MGYAIQKSVNFRLSEVTFDGFWVPVRLVAEILLHVEIHLTSIRPDIWGGGISFLISFLHCMKSSKLENMSNRNVICVAGNIPTSIPICNA